MQHSSILTKLLTVFEWITRLATANLMWFVTSLPLLFIGLNLLLAQTAEQVTTLVITLIVIAPFTIFPSLSALMSVVSSWREAEPELYAVRTYLNKYRSMFKGSMRIGIILEILFLSGVMLITFLPVSIELKLVFNWLLSTVAIVVSLLVIVSMVTNELNLKDHVRNACLMTVSFPFSSFFMGLFVQGLFILSGLYAQFLIPFFLMSGICFLIKVKVDKDVERVMRLKSK